MGRRASCESQWKLLEVNCQILKWRVMATRAAGRDTSVIMLCGVDMEIQVKVKPIKLEKFGAFTSDLNLCKNYQKLILRPVVLQGLRCSC